MKIELGKEGLESSWQMAFEETVECPKCGGESRIMFVASEGDDDDPAWPGQDFVHGLHENVENGRWPHGCIAVAVYLCRDCIAVVSILNQA